MTSHTAWNAHGCPRCRHEWYDHSGPDLVLHTICDNIPAMTRVSQCSACDAYWGDGPGILPAPLTPAEAEHLIRTAHA